MKRIFFMSGIVFLLMTLLVLTGMIKLNQSILNSINSGNAYYKNRDYVEARETYEEALNKEPQNTDILHNLGLAAYALEDYEKAIEYYTDGKDCSMLLGNAYYRQGSLTNDPTQQLKIYRQGLEQYLTGIKAQPNNIEIKYNYEFLKKLIDDGEKKQDQQNQEQQSEEQQNEEQQNKEPENQEQENQNRQNDDRDDQSSEEQENDQQKEDNNKEDNQSQNSLGETSDSEEQVEQDKKAIEQVLKMLEQQEKQSLKNNQNVMGRGEEEANDW